MNQAPEGWEDIFDYGEELLWQGRPDTAFVWQKKHLQTTLLGLVITGFGVVWITMTSTNGGYFWLLGIGFLLIGPLLALAPPYMNTLMRGSTWYSLSNKRAFIATERKAVGRKLRAYPIDPDFVLEFDHADPATIYFALEVRQSGSGPYTAKIGFERINDGQEVYDMMVAIQKGQQ